MTRPTNDPDTVDADRSRECLLDVTDLKVRFDTSDETVFAVNGIDIALERNQTLGLVGESGSGKSVTALSILQLLENTADVSGSIEFDGANLLTKSTAEMRDVRGDRISMVFQDPGSSLNPVLEVGDQIAETIRSHRPSPGEEISWLERTIVGNIFRSTRSITRNERAWDQTIELFERVGIPLPEQRALEYPHEFSGGMKQRALIAMAISCQPDLLICDEPTTALDVTIEAQILDLIDELQSEFGTAVLFITHDMGVVRKVCDRVAVMYAGSIIEEAATEELYESPKHPYTSALLESVPKLDRRASLNPVGGRVPDLTTQPTGCPFAPRCEHENDACHGSFPPGYAVDPDSDPLPVRHRSADDQPVSSPPPRRATPSGSDDRPSHRTHCVLYGDGDHLTSMETDAAVDDATHLSRTGDSA